MVWVDYMYAAVPLTIPIYMIVQQQLLDNNDGNNTLLLLQQQQQQQLLAYVALGMVAFFMTNSLVPHIKVRFFFAVAWIDVLSGTR
jgi:hypothetical protein